MPEGEAYEGQLARMGTRGSSDRGSPVQQAQYVAELSEAGPEAPAEVLVEDTASSLSAAVQEAPPDVEAGTRLRSGNPEPYSQPGSVPLPGRLALLQRGSQMRQDAARDGPDSQVRQALFPAGAVPPADREPGQVALHTSGRAGSQSSWNLLGPLRQVFTAGQPDQPADTVKIPLSGSVPPDAVRVDRASGLVSIVVRDVPLNEILAILADHQGLNIITAEDVTAPVSVTLNNVPFEQALTHILSVVGYTWVLQDEILIVTNVTTSSKATPQAQGRELRVFSLNYVSATDLDTVIQGLLSPVGQSFITESTESDKRKTQELLVVEDLPAYLYRVEQYVRQADRPPRQVLIEAHVLAVELEDDAKHGINWEYLDLGNPEITLRTQGFADVAKFAAGTSPAFFFNLAATDLNVLVEALETSTDAKTLARPKVLALNGQKARIQIGERLGYRVTTVTETSATESVNFLEVGVVLDVTPWITEEGSVLMQVKPKVSSGQINPDTDLPDEETTEVETALMLPDGHGMVIGGLIQEEDVETQRKIPIVGDFWLVGRLFQSRQIDRKRTEIIVALIPHVVPYQPERHGAECEQFNRATTPLTYGPLRQNPRPGEPRFPDAGQHLGLRHKAGKSRALPDRRRWCPEGSREQCVPGLQPIESADLQGAPSR